MGETYHSNFSKVSLQITERFLMKFQICSILLQNSFQTTCFNQAFQTDIDNLSKFSAFSQIINKEWLSMRNHALILKLQFSQINFADP